MKLLLQLPLDFGFEAEGRRRRRRPVVQEKKKLLRFTQIWSEIVRFAQIPKREMRGLVIGDW